ncbi:MAG TPA: DNA polymerase III subunit alpha, partial [Pyrinomonadaceae bacterium]|nr:DNA polymerase III subunit alpha [Pyrinomonadaceae bacterium]
LAPQDRFSKGHPSDDEEMPPYSPGRSGMSHLILLCQNEIGYQNLCKLVSIGYLEGFYYRPRIDKEVLAKYSEGLIATGACMKGEIANLILMGNVDKAIEALKFYQSIFPGRFYLELQRNGLTQQMILNDRYQEFSKDFGVPLIATADVHYIKREQSYAQEVLMNIHRGKTIEPGDRSNIRSDEFYFKSQETMKQEFSFCPEAIANTQVIANCIDFEFKFTDDKGRKIYHFPKFDPPEGMTAVEHLNDLGVQGLEERFLEIEKVLKRPLTQYEKQTYDNRLDRELKDINEMGFTGYFLIVADFIRFGKTHDIPVGPGRGSGAGSLVAYALKITELDPLEHSLLFERFLNPERVSLPDFDIDFCMDKRDQMIEYVTQKYGKESVAQIITFGKLQARGVIRDVGRVFGLAASEVDKIAKLVPETLNITLGDALEQEPRI